MNNWLGNSNNTNKLSPQELGFAYLCHAVDSNNTNKLSPQELALILALIIFIQIIQINLVLKNQQRASRVHSTIQIIQINLVLKNFYI